MGDRDLDRLARRELEKGMVFILKPRVRKTSGKGQASIGDTVVVDDHGAQRLGTREMKLIVAD
jgi:Xaa-Pro aminopeptidase